MITRIDNLQPQLIDELRRAAGHCLHYSDPAADDLDRLRLGITLKINLNLDQPLRTAHHHGARADIFLNRRLPVSLLLMQPSITM